MLTDRTMIRHIFGISRMCLLKITLDRASPRKSRYSQIISLRVTPFLANEILFHFERENIFLKTLYRCNANGLPSL